MEQEEYYISVGEPWDFESQDGQNVIKGRIISFRSNDCIVFKSNYCLNFDDVRGDVLILTPRHREHDFSDLINGMVVINGGVLLEEYNENLDEEKLKESMKFKIIGSIRRIQYRTV